MNFSKIKGVAVDAYRPPTSLLSPQNFRKSPLDSQTLKKLEFYSACCLPYDAMYPCSMSNSPMKVSFYGEIARVAN